MISCCLHDGFIVSVVIVATCLVVCFRGKSASRQACWLIIDHAVRAKIILRHSVSYYDCMKFRAAVMEFLWSDGRQTLNKLPVCCP